MISVVLIVMGTLVAPMINWAIYAWSWIPRNISPWSPKLDDAPQRQLSDYVPVIGWLGLRREESLHGRFFWLRPLMIELTFGVILAALYWWEVTGLRLLPEGLPAALAPVDLARTTEWMQILFFGHAVLLVLLTIATFIDFDDQTIPDAVTIPGTMFALLLAVVSVEALPPQANALVLPKGSAMCLPWFAHRADGTRLEATLYSSPMLPDLKWMGIAGLMLGLGIFSIWVFALSDRRWIGRKGFSKAIGYFFVRWMRRNSMKTLVLGKEVTIWIVLLAIWLVGVVGIASVYQWGGDHWLALLSALIGLGLGGVQIWAVRIVAGAGLGTEAMGFGDVTLMAMVGAFVGWQVALLAFFLAPFTAILIVITSWLLTGNRMLPFGPYLAAASLLTIVFWDRIWNGWGAQTFHLGPVIGAILVFFLFLMLILLIGIRLLKRAFGIE